MFQSKPIVTAVPYHEIYDNTGTGLQGSGESTSWKSNLVQNMKVILHTPHTMQWCGLGTGEAGRKGIGKSSVTIMIVLLSKKLWPDLQTLRWNSCSSCVQARWWELWGLSPQSLFLDGRWYIYMQWSPWCGCFGIRGYKEYIWDVNVGNAKSNRIYCFWMSLLKANANNCDLL